MGHIMLASIYNIYSLFTTGSTPSCSNTDTLFEALQVILKCNAKLERLVTRRSADSRCPLNCLQYVFAVCDLDL